MNALLDDFLTRSVLAGLGVALAAGPLGSFVVWRRVTYFGDATAHAAILGVALALAFDLSVFVGALVASIAMAFAVSALTVAVAIKVVGVLLIAALLIIPAAARPFSDTPERMAVLATIGGVVSVLAGIGAAWQFDLQAGPAIACAAATLFALSTLSRGVRRSG